MGRLNQKKCSLSRLFARYLLTVAASLLGTLVVSILLLQGMLCSGLLLPANTAETQLHDYGEQLQSGTLQPIDLPFYYRWAILNMSGEPETYSPLPAKRQQQLLEAVETEQTVISDFPFSQYHRLFLLPGDRLCIIQYDFSTPYTVPWMQKFLPDGQICILLLYIILSLLVILFWTKRYARRLGHDAEALTAAARAIQEQQLDTSFTQNTCVCEFDETLQAMDLLRHSLSASLHEQWELEQQRAQEIAALTHDLKTPLTVISGNSELLAESELRPDQQPCVDAIGRNAEKMAHYLDQLRTISSQQYTIAQKEPVSLSQLFGQWVTLGEELCAPKAIRFISAAPPHRNGSLELESVCRAVQNLLENAVRYTPEGGEIHLSAAIAQGVLQITVQDSGPGFTKEALIHGCDLFYTENSSRQSNGNTGMGLYYAQCVASRHQGSVTLTNTDTGASVTMLLRITE